MNFNLFCSLGWSEISDWPKLKSKEELYCTFILCILGFSGLQNVYQKIKDKIMIKAILKNLNYCYDEH